MEPGWLDGSVGRVPHNVTVPLPLPLPPPPPGAPSIQFKPPLRLRLLIFKKKITAFFAGLVIQNKWMYLRPCGNLVDTLVFSSISKVSKRKGKNETGLNYHNR